MDTENENILKLQDWSLDEDEAILISKYEKDVEIGVAKTEDLGVVHSKADFATEYLELSDDEDDAKQNYDIGGIDTIGRSDDIVDVMVPKTNELPRNPLDGLPYTSHYYNLLEQRQQLAIWQAKDDFVLAVDESPIVLVTGKAGSGKSTQIPQWCTHFAKEMDFELGTVVCTQPNGLSAMSLAIQVSREMDLTSIGNEVGYKIPFSDVTSDDTILKFCTDEILLREMTADPYLERYSIVIVDEVQERTVSTDILLTLLRIISTHRETLKIVVISLPNEMPKLEEFFDGVPVVDLSYLEKIETRKERDNRYVGFAEEMLESNSKSDMIEGYYRAITDKSEEPRIYYRMKDLDKADFISEALEIITQAHCDQDIDGDILVFMSGVQEINEVCERVAQEVAMKVLRGEAGDITLVPLHSLLPYSAQQAVYEKLGSTATSTENGLRARKVIVSDRIAESSFSVGNISFVIDSGRERANNYNCRTRARSDFVVAISKVSANLRCRRCSPRGRVYRLYSESEYESFVENRSPSITQSELSTHVLLMKRLLQRLDVSFSSCQTLDPPAPDNYMQALEDLDYHGALDENGDLSDLGAVMSEFPLSLRLAKSVIASCGELCTEEMLTIASMLVVPPFFVTQTGSKRKSELCRLKMSHQAGDHFTAMNIYNEFHLHKESEHWCKENFVSYPSLKLAIQVRSELVMVMDRLELPRSTKITNPAVMEASVKKALLAGFFMQIAKDVDGSGNYLIVRDRHVARLNPQSTVKDFPEWVVFNEFSLSDYSYILTVSEVTMEMIAEITPPSYQANLPSGEIKQMLIDSASKLRELNQTNSDVEENPSCDQATSRTRDNSPNDIVGVFEGASGGLADDTPPPERQDSMYSKTYRYSGYRAERFTGRTTSDDTASATIETNIPQGGDIDIISQTARDLNYVYQQASSYVRNYNYDDDEQSCIVQ